MKLKFTLEQGEYRYSFTLSLTLALDWGLGGQRHASTDFPLGKGSVPILRGAGWPRLCFPDPPSQKICTSQITTLSLFILFQLSKLTTDINENDTKNYSNSKFLMARFEVLRDVVEDLSVTRHKAVLTGK